MPGIGPVWPAKRRRTEKRWNSIFSISREAPSTDTCTTRFLPWSTRTITSRTGLTWNQGTSRSMRTSTCSGRNDGERILGKDDLETLMDREWNDSQPIYRQLRDRVVAMILDGVLKEGDPLPSVRTVAAEYRVNHLTVLKGYQQLVDEQLVESKRGRGMFITAGARDRLLQAERQKFLAEQWPRIQATIQRLGLTPEDLLGADANRRSNSDTAEEDR